MLIAEVALASALGLLFAGSETGGDNGTGLTYLNPIDANENGTFEGGELGSES